MPNVKFYATLRQITKSREAEVRGMTVGEVLENLSTAYEGKLQRYLKSSTVLVNDKNVKLLEGRDTRLDPDDVVSIYPPLGGG